VRGAADYSLGDSDLAAERLALAARIFGPGRARLPEAIGAAAPPAGVRPGLRPGPQQRGRCWGHRAQRIVGLDSSEIVWTLRQSVFAACW